MIEKADFEKLVRLAIAEPVHQNMLLVIIKELFHADILFALDKERLLDGLPFCGAYHYGCDRGQPIGKNLAFTDDRGSACQDLVSIKQCIQDCISRRYQFVVGIKAPAELRGNPSYAAIKVNKW
ncbi:hypothetical protein [Phytohalomonas tamaricis]|uniref:hypothetical protein n=1 Tax=Phytohalomonas tamaricis TaxID=2081032 RepID=UPI000D0B2390|nr:hypothetical protein [Phytohalomonas tamaricis]